MSSRTRVSGPRAGAAAFLVLLVCTGECSAPEPPKGKYAPNTAAAPGDALYTGRNKNLHEDEVERAGFPFPEEKDAQSYGATRRPRALPAAPKAGAAYDSPPLNSVFFERFGNKRSDADERPRPSTATELLDDEYRRMREHPETEYSPHFINLDQLSSSSEVFPSSFTSLSRGPGQLHYAVRDAEISIPLANRQGPSRSNSAGAGGPAGQKAEGEKESEEMLSSPEPHPAAAAAASPSASTTSSGPASSALALALSTSVAGEAGEHDVLRDAALRAADLSSANGDVRGRGTTSTTTQEPGSISDVDVEPHDHPAGGPRVHLASPPMGWMSWENFRCQRDCATHPEDCVSEKLYKGIAEVLAEDGYVAAGYNILWIDDCWMAGRGPNKEFLGGGKKDPVSGASTLARDPVTGDLVADSSRFPSGMKSLGEDFRRKGLFLGLYACAGRLTCEQDAGSMGHEEQDMRLFASWGVKYLKVDGCFVPEGALESQYVKIGRALRDKDIVYACSWPAYLQTGEKEKPFREMYERAGCNMWRNFGDISNSFSVLKAIIIHWAKETQGLENEAPAHAFNDPDMILAGSDHSAGADNSGFNYEHGLEFRLAVAEARIQYAVWAIVAAPLLLSADVRKLRNEEGQAYRDLILNEIMIGVNQDPNGIRGGCRAGCESDLQLWARQLTDGSTAISIVNLSTEKIPHYQFSTKLQNEPVAVRDVFPKYCGSGARAASPSEKGGSGISSSTSAGTINEAASPAPRRTCETRGSSALVKFLKASSEELSGGVQPGQVEETQGKEQQTQKQVAEARSGGARAAEEEDDGVLIDELYASNGEDSPGGAEEPSPLKMEGDGEGQAQVVQHEQAAEAQTTPSANKNTAAPPGTTTTRGPAAPTSPRRTAEVASNVGPGGAIAWRILFSAGTRTVQEADGRTRQKPELKADVTFTDIEPRSTVFLVLQASDRLFPLEDAQIDEDYAHDLHPRTHGLVAGKQKGGNRNQLQEGGKTTNQPPHDLYINDAANQFLNHAVSPPSPKQGSRGAAAASSSGPFSTSSHQIQTATRVKKPQPQASSGKYMNVACLLALVIQCSLVGGAVVILTTCVSEWRKRWQDRRKLAATILYVDDASSSGTHTALNLGLSSRPMISKGRGSRSSSKDAGTSSSAEETEKAPFLAEDYSRESYSEYGQAAAAMAPRVLYYPEPPSSEEDEDELGMETNGEDKNDDGDLEANWRFSDAESESEDERSL